MEKRPVPEETALRNLRMLFWLGVGVAAVGIYVIGEQLGRQKKWNSLLGDYIGGTDPQAVFFGVLIVAAGVGLAAWAKVVEKRD